MQYLKYKDSDWKTKDLTNKSGCITSYLKSKNIEDSDYMKYFNLVNIEIPDSEYIKCPICNIKFHDKENKSGNFTIHIEKIHNISVEDFLIKFPEYDNIWKIKQQKIKRNKLFQLKENYIKCAICNEKFKSITNTHIQKHGMTQLEYKERFKSNTISQYTSNKLSTLYAQKTFKINKASKEEKSVREFIESIYPNTKIYNSRKYTSGREIDIYLPDNNIAIEYAGLYYHSENSTGKGNKYHIEQLQNCIDNNIKLQLIFSDEWKYKSNIVKNKLKLVLNTTSEFIKLHGRKCIIKPISAVDKDSFLLENHLQGTDKSKIRLGAYFSNELVAVMTFGKVRLALGNKQAISGEHELVRYCVKNNYIVHGIASKLLQYFITNYQPKKITTFADRRWSDDSFYKKLGFNLVKITAPNYWYTKGYETRLHRYNFTKHKILNLYNGNPILTEWENMKLLKYDRIWDCGNLKFEMILK